MFIAQYIILVIRYSRLNWTKICTNLKKEYKDQDLAQQISFCAYLEAFKNKPRTENAKVLQFCSHYLEISKVLLGKKKLDRYTQLRWFLQGLLSLVQSKLFNYYNLDLNGKVASNFESIKKGYSFIKPQKKKVKLGTTNMKNNEMSDLIDCSANKPSLTFHFWALLPFELCFPGPVVPSMPLVTISLNLSNKKIDCLTDMMQSLALLVCTLQENTSAFSVTF